jgi:hypothetical protein
MQRRGFNHILSFPDRLAEEAERLHAEAEKLPHGHERDLLLRKARQTETAAHVNEWLTSPGLSPPK